jgi:hypothetical protein
VAAIPDAGGARCAPCGVMRALSRAAVLGGLVVAGWLLGSGIGLANENLGHPGTGLVKVVSDRGEGAAQADGGSGGQLGVPPTVSSTVRRVRSAVSVPQRPAPPPVKLGVLKPVVNAVSVPKPLAHILAPQPRPAEYGADIRAQALADEPAAIPPTEPAGPAAAATAPGSPRGRATVLTTAGHALPIAPTRAAADRVAERLALSDDPATPVPASPPASTTSAWMTGGTGSGAGTKSVPDVVVNDSWASAGLAPMHRLGYPSAGDLPRSPAAQPSTSPD